MKKLMNATFLNPLSKEEQKMITGGGDCQAQYWQTCCSSGDDCMDPMSEDNGQYYSVCQGGVCVDIWY
jgi:hypothetical protein